MGERIQAIRGFNDILPDKSFLWSRIEQVIEQCMYQYGYSEIRLPLVESTQLFKRSIGEVTDIVEKEMYTFTDLNGESLTLRPEGTAGCVRACLEHGLLYNQQQRLWYVGPMFRHEKPQKGRYRQFYQFGVEAFGIADVAIELELIAITHRLWRQLAVADYLRLEINTLGTLAERQSYRATLIQFFEQSKDQLDEDSLRRLHTNPLRILDSKNPSMQALIAKAPKLIDCLGEESKQRFTDFCQGLDEIGVSYTINPRLVRGLDYYAHTVFEWVTDKLGSQATVCGGGRFDALFEHLGGESTSAVGFAMGLERLLILLETLNIELQTPVRPALFIMATSKKAMKQALFASEMLRDTNANWSILTNTAGGSFKSQFKKADKSGAQFAVIFGDDEIEKAQVSLKNLRKHEEQVTIAQEELINYLSRMMPGEQ